MVLIFPSYWVTCGSIILLCSLHRQVRMALWIHSDKIDLEIYVSISALGSMFPLCPGSSSSHEAIWYPRGLPFHLSHQDLRAEFQRYKWNSKLEIHQVWRLALKLDFHNSLHGIDAMRHSLTNKGRVISRGDMNVLSHGLEHAATRHKSVKDAWQGYWDIG